MISVSDLLQTALVFFHVVSARLTDLNFQILQSNVSLTLQ